MHHQHALKYARLELWKSLPQARLPFMGSSSCPPSPLLHSAGQSPLSNCQVERVRLKSSHQVWHSWRRTILAFICFVFSAAFTLALMGFLIMHLRLVGMNQTTIEAYEKRPIK